MKREKGVDYSNFRLEDFLANEDFVKWARSSKADRDTFWYTWIENHPEHREKVFEARQIARNMHFDGMRMKDEDYDAMLGNILSRNYSRSRNYINIEKKERRRFLHNIVKIAASLTLIAVLGLYLAQMDKPVDKPTTMAEELIVKTAKRGQKLTVMLPDSSIVKLNSESTLTYSSQFLERRFVQLEGEAFFEVMHREGQPFTVQSHNLSTTVLGTSFNVRAYPHMRTEAVSLVSGKVRVQKNSDREEPPVELSPREKLQYNTNTGSMSFVPFRTSETLWKDGILIFRNTDLSEFVATIERWYDVDVIVQGNPDEDWQINGGRFENEPLELVLESLKFAEKIQYVLDGKNVTIKI